MYAYVLFNTFTLGTWNMQVINISEGPKEIIIILSCDIQMTRTGQDLIIGGYISHLFCEIIILVVCTVDMFAQERFCGNHWSKWPLEMLHDFSIIILM